MGNDVTYLIGGKPMSQQEYDAFKLDKLQRAQAQAQDPAQQQQDAARQQQALLLHTLDRLAPPPRAPLYSEQFSVKSPQQQLADSQIASQAGSTRAALINALTTGNLDAAKTAVAQRAQTLAEQKFADESSPLHQAERLTEVYARNKGAALTLQDLLAAQRANERRFDPKAPPQSPAEAAAAPLSDRIDALGQIGDTMRQIGNDPNVKTPSALLTRLLREHNPSAVTSAALENPEMFADVLGAKFGTASDAALGNAAMPSGLSRLGTWASGGPQPSDQLLRTIVQGLANKRSNRYRLSYHSPSLVGTGARVEPNVGY